MLLPAAPSGRDGRCSLAERGAGQARPPLRAAAARAIVSLAISVNMPQLARFAPMIPTLPVSRHVAFAPSPAEAGTRRGPLAALPASVHFA
jgi:hypothetical protein